MGDTLCVTQQAEKPDRVYMDGSSHINMSDPLPTPANAQHGDWYYDDVAGKLSYYSKSNDCHQTTMTCTVSHITGTGTTVTYSKSHH